MNKINSGRHGASEAGLGRCKTRRGNGVPDKRPGHLSHTFTACPRRIITPGHRCRRDLAPSRPPGRPAPTPPACPPGGEPRRADPGADRDRLHPGVRRQAIRQERRPGGAHRRGHPRGPCRRPHPRCPARPPAMTPRQIWHARAVGQLLPVRSILITAGSRGPWAPSAKCGCHSPRMSPGLLRAR